MWEASVSIRHRNASQPWPIITLQPHLGGLLVDKCNELLDGVGDRPAGFWHIDSVSVHFRQPMLQSEMDELPEGWLACPAVDTGGSEDRMTKLPPFPSRP